MSDNLEHNPDDKTVLLDHGGKAPDAGRLTNASAPPRIENLSARMVYATHSGSAGVVNTGFTPLVAAACDLLSEVARLKHGQGVHDPKALNLELANKLQQFDIRAAQSGVDSGQIRNARYVLCTVIDEAAASTSWGKDSSWSQMSLLSRFFSETFGGERFFQLLDRLSRDPVKHLPMLELMYLCLSLGFEGKYAAQPRGKPEVDAITDALYRLIRHFRGDVPPQLSPHWEGVSQRRRNVVRMVPVWMVALFTVFCMGVMYAGFSWVLSKQRDVVLRPYQPVDSAPGVTDDPAVNRNK